MIKEGRGQGRRREGVSENVSGGFEGHVSGIVRVKEERRKGGKRKEGGRQGG